MKKLKEEEAGNVGWKKTGELLKAQCQEEEFMQKSE